MVSARSRTISRKRKRYNAANYKGYRPKSSRVAKLRRYNRNARIGGFLGLELKFLDCAWNGVALASSTDGSGGELQPSSGCTNAISVPAQGDGESQRDGRKFCIKSVYVNGIISTAQLQDHTDAEDLLGYWFALVLDTQANGATLVSENVYLNPSTSAISILPQPLRNLQNSTRYRILDSKFIGPGGAYGITDGTATASVSNQVSPKVTLSWKGSINVDTTGTTANVSSCADNAIHVLAYCGSTALTPSFFGKSRMRFMG